MKKWFDIVNKADKAEIWIYEQIGEDWWSGEGTTAKSFQKELAGIKASQIDLHINSPGGEVFDGITIYNLIKQHPANVTTYIDGLAASIASVIALAGDKVIMAENALYMIHQPWGFAIGNASEMRKVADNLDKVSDSLITSYTVKTGKADDEIKTLLDAETWMSADEAFEMGFVDEVAGKMDMAACAKFAPVMKQMGFKNIPDITVNKEMPTARDAEKALRDAGFSAKQAKTIVSKGYSEGLRDEEIQDNTSNPNQRDVGANTKRDRVADLLIRAEKLAPSITNKEK